MPRWLSLVDASRNREHPPRKRNGRILPRKVAGSKPARGSNHDHIPTENRYDGNLRVFPLHTSRSLIDDLRSPLFDSNSTKIKGSLVNHIDGHDDQAGSANTPLDHGFGRWLGGYSSRSSSYTATGDRYSCHQSYIPDI